MKMAAVISETSLTGKFSGLAMVLLLKPMLAAHLQVFLGAFSKLRSIAQLFFGSSPALQFCLHGERVAGVMNQSVFRRYSAWCWF